MIEDRLCALNAGLDCWQRVAVNEQIVLRCPSDGGPVESPVRWMVIPANS